MKTNSKKLENNQQVKRRMSKSKRKTINFNFLWERKKRPGFGAEVFINVKFIVFIVLSIISAFINLIFIAGLTKSPYILGDTRGWYLSIPAAFFLGCLSIGLDLSKALHVIQVNTLNSLARHLSDESWVGRIKKVAHKWTVVYVLYVALSVITSVSLSSISIGSGITRNANLRDQVNEYIGDGEMYSNINKEAKNVNRSNLIGKATDTSEQEAIDFAKDKINEIWPVIEEYQLERTEFINAGLNINSRETVEWNGKEIVPTTYWEKRNNEVNSKLTGAGYPRQTGPAILQLNRSTLQTAIKNRQLESSKTANTDEATAKLNELTDETSTEARAWLETLNTLQLINPKTNEVVVFDVSEDKPASVLVKTAVTQLKALKVDIENDSGDIGISSKIFMQLGGWITSLSNKNEDTGLESVLTNSTRSSTFGPTEIMMMLMLLFLSLLCELGINQFSPEVSISRRMLGQFRRYFDKDFDVNKFMLGISIDLNDYDLITDEDLANEVEHVRNKLRRKAEIAALLNGEDIEDVEAEIQDSKLPKKAENSKRVSKKQEQSEKEEQTIKDAAESTEKENSEIEAVRISDIINPDVLKNVNLKELAKEVPMDKPNWEKERESLTQRPVLNEQTQPTENSILKYKPGTIGYSEEVDNAIGEIDALLSEENN